MSQKDNTDSDATPKPKRGRRPKNREASDPPSPTVEKVPGKRGRKPKGGKLINYPPIINFDNSKENKHNIILHLRCHKKDVLATIDNKNNQANVVFGGNLSYGMIGLEQHPVDINTISLTQTTNTINDIHNKIKQLGQYLHINKPFDSKSACFWCTCDFDNPPIYIPSDYSQSDGYKAYGCFCCPECATGYLFGEHLESSILFERYHYMNHLYGKIYNYTKNIKPAPSPHYILDKFCGNMTIQEYRNMSEFKKLYLVTNKPITPILPELHEDNDDMLLHRKIIPTGVKRIGDNKTSIIHEHFKMNGPSLIV